MRKVLLAFRSLRLCIRRRRHPSDQCTGEPARGWISYQLPGRFLRRPLRSAQHPRKRRPRPICSVDSVPASPMHPAILFSDCLIAARTQISSTTTSTDTTSYIPRFHTITMDSEAQHRLRICLLRSLRTLRHTTLLFSLTPLVYGTGDGIVGSGVPPQNNFLLPLLYRTLRRLRSHSRSQQLRQPALRPLRPRRHPPFQRRPQRLHLRRVRPVRL